MITAITTCTNLKYNKFPFDLSIKSWLDACDELIVITNKNDPTVWPLLALAKTNPKIKVRAIEHPNNFDTYRFFGYYYATPVPEFIIHFDVDYIIAPAEAKQLYNLLKELPDHVDIVTYTLRHLNYNATKTMFIPMFASHNTPFDGVNAEHPLIVNPRKQNFISPYEGVTEDNTITNYENVLSLHPDHWGKNFNTKYLNHNPYNFNIVRSGTVVEHLTFSLSREALQKKLSHQFWKDQNINIQSVINGYIDYDISYPMLDEARKRYNIS